MLSNKQIIIKKPNREHDLKDIEQHYVLLIKKNETPLTVEVHGRKHGNCMCVLLPGPLHVPISSVKYVDASVTLLENKGNEPLKCPVWLPSYCSVFLQ